MSDRTKHGPTPKQNKWKDPAFVRKHYFKMDTATFGKLYKKAWRAR